jgi:ribosomal protein L25 (general stress protein Ctc)
LSTPIQISLKDFEKVFKTAGESTVIELTGLGAPKQALIHDVDIDPVTGSIRHADFYVIEKGQR